MLSFPLWKLQLSVRVWGAAPDFHGAAVLFVYVVYPQSGDTPAAHTGYRLNGGAMLRGLCLSFSPLIFTKLLTAVRTAPS